MALWSIQPLREMSARNLPGGKGRRSVRREEGRRSYDLVGDEEEE
jgi:hypothetical protein